MHCNTV